MKATKVKKKHSRLERPKKQYQINQCALYGINGFGQLLKCLKWSGSIQDLISLSTSKGSYKVWVENGRTIQAASDDLRVIHVRIATLLRRVVPPNYRHSGVRSRSFITNAEQHLADEPSVKLDIKKFYPSTTHRQIRKFFSQEMCCALDVAEILATICSFHKKHLPTGGVHSEVLAFCCNKKSFDALSERAVLRGGVISVYVDDIMITMPNASLTDLEWARKLFATRGIKIHTGKSKVICKREEKHITGVRIKSGKMLAPQSQHLKIKMRNKELSEATTAEQSKSIALSLIGHYDHISQIDKRFKSQAVGSRARLSKLIKN